MDSELTVGNQFEASTVETPSRRRGEATSTRRKPRSKVKPRIHKYSRALHAYVSAFAFIILMFFAASGLLLNHPEWFVSNEKTEVPERVAEISLEVLDKAENTNNPEVALANLVQERLPLRGVFQSAEIFPGEEAFLRFSGVKGSSDVIINLETGGVEYEVETFGLTQIIHNLHRGKDSGTVWKGLIDVSAILILALSLFGFCLMFFVKQRLAKNLLLLGLSLVALSVVYVGFVS
ncbi:PepSY-associated TM helix domain-containing protein [Puniceicoccaceae bacterium K14]|nr:PepSY-associated TM helix domain-containing protein [Puniceicoccaceae bacterium K14]